MLVPANLCVEVLIFVSLFFSAEAEGSYSSLVFLTQSQLLITTGRVVFSAKLEKKYLFF